MFSCRLVLVIAFVLSYGEGYLREGDVCYRASTGERGQCTYLKDCPVALSEMELDIETQMCSFSGIYSLVCCLPRLSELPASTKGGAVGEACVLRQSGLSGTCTHIANCSAAQDGVIRGVYPQVCFNLGTVPVVCCALPTAPLAATPSLATTQPPDLTGTPWPFDTSSERPGTQGASCTTATGAPGACQPFASCPSAREAASRGILPQRCSQYPGSSLVCCETSCPPLPPGVITQQKTGSKANDYCVDLAEKIFPCQRNSSGWSRGNICPTAPDTRVFLDTPLNTTAEAPHYAMLGWGELDDIRWRCQAALISERWLLCAAWCLFANIIDLEHVGLGGSITPRFTPSAVHSISRKVPHPEFNRELSVVYNDIALVQMETSVTFSRSILPACLHMGASLTDDLSRGLIVTELSTKSTMESVSQTECEEAFPFRSSDFPDGVRDPSQLCARPETSGGECPGYSWGSPLTGRNGFKVACTRLLVGLHSTLRYDPCMRLFTRVAPFVPWIEGIVWP